MNTNSNNSQPSFQVRLAAFLVVLAVGFFMGWLNGQGGRDAANSGVVATQAAEEQQAAQDAADDERDEATNGDTLADASDDEPAAPAPADEQDDGGSATVAPTRGPTVEEDGWYTSKEEVALYIHTYGHLPGNFISKTKARDRGWVASEGNLDEVCPGMSIGGSRFYNDDGTLPEKSGRRWTECDINYTGGFRGAERIVFSNDGLVFYTDDHYETFEQLY